MTDRTTPGLESETPGPDRAAAGSGARRGRQLGIVLAILVACQLMLVLDSTIVNIALPRIKESLRFSTTGGAWVINAYLLGFGGMLLLGGRIGDILGRRGTFVAGVALFTVASLLGGFARSAEWLIAMRAAQGTGAAIAAPSTLALLTTNFGEGRPRIRALGIYSAVSAGGASIGLVVGGILTSFASWRWVMFVNVPIGVVVILFTMRYVHEPERRSGRFDVLGALTSTSGMTALVYGFIRAASDGWADPQTVVSFVAAAVLLALFVLTETRVEQPIFPLRLLADSSRASSFASMLLMGSTSFGMFFFLTQFVQEVLGFAPVVAGVAFLPLTVAIFSCMRAMPNLLPTFGAKPLMLAGMMLVIIAMVWLSRLTTESSYAGGVLGPMLVYGIGSGITFISLTTVILSGVRGEESGAASGMLQAMQQLGGCLGLAILVTVFGIAGKSPGHSTDHARQALAGGIAWSFTAGTVYVVCAMAIAILFIKTRHEPAS
jgi:EmrB/QacA subfamily drug resistance transporter